MATAAESNELFLSASGSPVHSMMPELGICKMILDTKLLKPLLLLEPSPKTIGVLWEGENSWNK